MSRPLSPAELEQRREAARSRWRRHAAAGGAVVAGTALAGALAAVPLEAEGRKILRGEARQRALDAREGVRLARQRAEALDRRITDVEERRFASFDKREARLRSRNPLPALRAQFSAQRAPSDWVATDQGTLAPRPGSATDWLARIDAAQEGMRPRPEAGRSGERRTARWQVTVMRPVDPLKRDAEARAYFERFVAGAMKPAAEGGQGLKRKDAEAFVRQADRQRFGIREEPRVEWRQGTVGQAMFWRGGRRRLPWTDFIPPEDLGFPLARPGQATAPPPPPPRVAADIAPPRVDRLATDKDAKAYFDALVGSLLKDPRNRDLSRETAEVLVRRSDRARFGYAPKDLAVPESGPRPQVERFTEGVLADAVRRVDRQRQGFADKFGIAWQRRREAANAVVDRLWAEAKAVPKAAPRLLTGAEVPRVAARGAAAGAALGALGYGLWQGGRWAKERLQKAAPPEEGEEPEKRVALTLGQAFRQWLAAPTEAGKTDSLEAAEAALREAFEAAAGAALPPEVTIGAHRGGGRRRLVFDLDARNPDVEHQARSFAAAKVSRIAEEARAAIRAVIVRGTEEGLDIPTQARLIRESIGLTQGQAAWVQNYRRELENGWFALARNRVLRDRRHDRLLDRLEAEGRTPSPEEVDRMAASYHRRVLAFRATNIARTEALSATNLGQLAGTRAFLAENPDSTVLKTWIATDDDRVRDDHWQLHGKTVEGLETPFLVTPADGSAPYEIRYPHDPLAPAHSIINCLLPGTRVAALALRAVTRRHYDGEAIRIETAAGVAVSVTVNHPVLTMAGWKPAHLLEMGEHLVGASRPHWAAGQVDLQDAPPRIEDLYEALQASRATVKVAAMVGFHGERLHGDVDVVRADRELPDHRETARLECLGKGIIADRLLGQRLLPGPRLGMAPGGADGLPSCRDVGCGHLPLALILRHLRPLQSLSLTASPEAHAVLAQDEGDAGARDGVPGGERLHGSPVRIGLEEATEVRGLPMLPRRRAAVGLGSEQLAQGAQTAADLLAHLLERKALGIEADRVVRVERFRWRGHVFNLEADPHLYLANGLVHHNCRCSWSVRIVPKPRPGTPQPLVAEAAAEAGA